LLKTVKRCAVSLLLVAFLAVAAQAQDFTKSYSNDTQLKADVLAAFSANAQAGSTGFSITFTGVGNLQAEAGVLTAYIQQNPDGMSGILYDYQAVEGADYAALCLRGLGASMSGGGTSLTLTVNPITYWETADQTAQVDAYVNAHYNAVITPGMTDYQKLKAIHDYITGNFQYDTSLQSYSAYSLIQSGKGVCQAFTMLYYKFVTKAGIGCRTVLRGLTPGSSATGTSGGNTENHTWNLVQLRGKWYHVDVTWDDPIGGSPNDNYFLKGNTTLSANHTWDTAMYDFVSDTDYVPTPGDMIPTAPAGTDVSTQTSGAVTTQATAGANGNSGMDGGPGDNPLNHILIIVLAATGGAVVLGFGGTIAFVLLKKDKEDNTGA